MINIAYTSDPVYYFTKEVNEPSNRQAETAILVKEDT